MNIVKNLKSDGNDTVTVHFRTIDGWKSETMTLTDFSYAIANPSTFDERERKND